jgi:hypothetical protein
MFKKTNLSGIIFFVLIPDWPSGDMKFFMPTGKNFSGLGPA